MLISCYHFSMLSLFRVRVPVLFWGVFSDFFIILDFRIFLTLSLENRYFQRRTCRKIEKVIKYIFWTNIYYQYVSSSSLKKKNACESISFFLFNTEFLGLTSATVQYWQNNIYLAFLSCVNVLIQLNFLSKGKRTFEGKECIKDVGLHNSFNYTVA